MTELLRVGVLGAGWAGELHLEAFRSQPEVELVALCSRTKSTAEAVAERYGVAKVVDDIDDFFGSDLDIISIATPPSSHVELTLRALASGAHVLCDKPTALTGVQAAEVYQAAEAAGVRHASGYIWRNDPAILHIRQLVAQGAIGRITDVQVRCALGAPVLPMTWMYDEKAGGGSLMQHGGHVIDRVRWLLGEEFAEVSGDLYHDVSEAVVGPQFHNIMDAFGWAGRRARDPHPEQLPTAAVTADSGYRFSGTTESGTRAHLWETWHGVGPVPDQVELYGTEGALVWCGAQGTTVHRPFRPAEQIVIPGSSEAGSRDMKDLRAVGERLWGQLVRAFVDDIRNLPHQDYPTLFDGWKVQQVIDAVGLSSESRVWKKC